MKRENKVKVVLSTFEIKKEVEIVIPTLASNQNMLKKMK
jgi:hypothetical protein